jgi:hypothetical protein
MRLATQVVTDDELDNSEFVRDVRALAFSLDIAPYAWLDYADVLLQGYRGWISDRSGEEVFLDMEEFDRAAIEDWFERFCCTPCPPEVTPRVQGRSRERVRIVATILRAHFPVQAMLWGVRAANVNHAPT